MTREKWVRVTDVRAFLSSGRVVKGVHSFTKRILHWPYCAHCGLVLLRNDTTRRAAKAACIQLED
jgi:hypothetical protein